MNHPIENRYRYGLCYDLNGQIVGFNLSPNVCIGLTDEEIEMALGEYAKRKYEQDDFLRTAGEIAKSINQIVGKTDGQNKEDEKEWKKEDDKNESVSSAKCDYRYMYRTDLSPMMPYPWNLINKNMAGLSAFKNMSSQYLAGSSDGYWHLTGFR